MHHILIVDDMKSFQNLEKSFLRRTDCSVSTAATGVEAIRKARDLKPDLILLDIEMPEMNGIEACRILSNDAATRSIPVIIISTLAKRRDEALKAGARDFLPKPITEDVFLDLVKKHTGIRVRQTPRVPVDFEAKACLADSNEFHDCRAKDLSEKGIFLVCDRPAPMGSEVKVEFRLPDRHQTAIACEGVVVRVVPPQKGDTVKPGAGIELTGLNDRQRAALTAYIQSVLG
jgi:CheY-like chemotaxis protein